MGRARVVSGLERDRRPPSKLYFVHFSRSLSHPCPKLPSTSNESSARTSLAHVSSLLLYELVRLEERGFLSKVEWFSPMVVHITQY